MSTLRAPRRHFVLRDRDSSVELDLGRTTQRVAASRAKRWAREGSYPDLTSTIWVDVDLLAGRECVETVTVVLDPPEPRCESAEGTHKWASPHRLVGGMEENPGVRGHGGGVKIEEACLRCGAQRLTDTWAQRPDTGQQGLESISYQPGGYYDLSEQAEAA